MGNIEKLKFTKNSSPYKAGDIAGFNKEVAESFIAKGVAEKFFVKEVIEEVIIKEITKKKKMGFKNKMVKETETK